MPDLLTWLNAERLSAEQTYRAERNPYHEGAVDALDRVIARVEKQAPPDLAPLRELVERWNSTGDLVWQEAARQLTRALDALEGKS